MAALTKEWAKWMLLLLALLALPAVADARTELTGDITINVPADKPTPQAAIDYVHQSLDLKCRTVTIQVANGTHGDVTASGPFTGSCGPENVVLQGNLSNSLSVTLGRVSAINGAQFSAKKFRTPQLSASRSGSQIIAYGLDFLRNLGDSHVYATVGGYIGFVGSYTISGSASFHYTASAIGFIDMEQPGATILIRWDEGAADPAVVSFTRFAHPRYLGFIDHKGVQVVFNSGTSMAIADYCWLTTFSSIHTESGNLDSYFSCPAGKPGNSASGYVD